MKFRLNRLFAPDRVIETPDPVATLEPIGYEAAWPLAGPEPDQREPATDVTAAGNR